jgi:bifunctional DNA-binding transcriptional regulator/antitoxin component of YhaV-PrlF toxin-antitoxin module
VRQRGCGQCAIPATIRRNLGIDPETMLAKALNGDEVRNNPLRLAERLGRSPPMRRSAR